MTKELAEIRSSIRDDFKPVGKDMDVSVETAESRINDLERQQGCQDKTRDWEKGSSTTQ